MNIQHSSNRLPYRKLVSWIRSATAFPYFALFLGVAAGIPALLLFRGADLHAETATIETELVTLESRILAEKLDHPWGMEFLPDGALLVTERSGQMRVVENGIVSPPITGFRQLYATNQGGLLDVALSPDFEQSGQIFFSFSEGRSGKSGTAIGRARLIRGKDAPRLEDVRTIFSASNKTSQTKHYGSRLVFHPDGTLFITLGDRGEQDRAQDMNDHAGSVLRINREGTVPADNPFADKANSKPELWSKGHRNPQGAIFDPVTDSLWVTEHGARGGDELNQVLPGRNYGWPEISYGRHYSGFKIGTGTSAPGFEQPDYYWDPSIAPSGLAVYRGEMFPEWRNDFLAGALKFQLLVRLKRDKSGKVTGEERLLKEKFGRIRDVNVAPDGSVYLLTDESNGKIIRLTRAP